MQPVEKFFPVRNYDLGATLESGQAFRWQRHGDSWTGIVGNRWVRLTPLPEGIHAHAIGEIKDWIWLEHYLQLRVDLDAVFATFPQEPVMDKAVAACRGLRLLRQDSWETLASFILSSTKQIVQIRQIIALLCSRYGEPIPAPLEFTTSYSFPTATRLANLTDAELRDCKMGFRAPYLLAAAKAVTAQPNLLDSLHGVSLQEARQKLTALHGVGPKIADCVLLFAYDQPRAFPVDVWVMKAIRQLYFPKRKPSREKLTHFITNHFGPNSGYAQQYLFHYMRVVS